MGNYQCVKCFTPYKCCNKDKRCDRHNYNEHGICLDCILASPLLESSCLHKYKWKCYLNM